MSGNSLYLDDTNILLRVIQRDDPEHAAIRAAVGALLSRGIDFVYTLQNMAEFWNVSTRPRARNGYGLTIEQTREAEEIERGFLFLPDNEAVYREWRRLVVEHRIFGVQVHGARLAAAMYAHGLTHILTANTPHFARFPGLTALHPDSVPA